MIYIGIDPGQTGGMAIIDNQEDIWVYDWPSVKGIDSLREHFKDTALPRFWRAVIEQQAPRSYIDKAGNRRSQGISSTGKIMENYGIWQGILQSFQIPFIKVTPQKWRKKIFNSMPRQTDKKAMSLDLARRLYPSVDLSLKKHDGRAEALLLAKYCQDTVNG